jgi:flagellar biosynthesis protein FlhB
MPLANQLITEITFCAQQKPWQNPHMHTTHNPFNSSFHLFYFLSAETSVYCFVNKSLNPSSYSAIFPTSKYGHIHLQSSVEGVKGIMIHYVYCIRCLFPITSKTSLLMDCMQLTPMIFLHMFLQPYLTLLSIMYYLATLTFTNLVWEGLV